MCEPKSDTPLFQAHAEQTAMSLVSSQHLAGGPLRREQGGRQQGYRFTRMPSHGRAGGQQEQKSAMASKSWRTPRDDLVAAVTQAAPGPSGRAEMARCRNHPAPPEWRRAASRPVASPRVAPFPRWAVTQPGRRAEGKQAPKPSRCKSKFSKPAEKCEIL